MFPPLRFDVDTKHQNKNKEKKYYERKMLRNFEC